VPRWLVAVLAGCGCLLALLVAVVVAVVAFGSFLLPSIEGPLVEDFTEEFVKDLPEKLISEEFPEAEPFLSPEKTDVEKKTATIRVTGTPGVAFKGGYATGAGTPDSNGVLEGVTPQDFEVPVRTDATEVAANVAKQDGEGKVELTLQLLAGGEVVEERSSTEGWVSV
jgi:hypothetical protein